METGLIRERSSYSVAHTVERLEELLKQKGIKLFALIDHSGEAEKAGLTMPPTKLLIFGNPKGGTPLMTAAPSVAIDLPLKILVAEDEAGQTWVSCNSPAYLQQRHGFPPELMANIGVAQALVQAAVS
jgi:uncharacterized protein (DUF302 family)